MKKQKPIKRHKSQESDFPAQLTARLREVVMIILAATSIFLFTAFYSYTDTDPGWTQVGTSQQIKNAGGLAGAYLADIFLYLFGYIAYLFPVIIGYSGWLVLRARVTGQISDYNTPVFRLVGSFLTLLCASALAALHFTTYGVLAMGPGGVFGSLLGAWLMALLNFQGATLLLLAMFLVGVTLATGLSWLRLMDNCGRWLMRGLRWTHGWVNDRIEANADDEIAVEKPIATSKKNREPVLFEAVPMSREIIPPLYFGEKDEPILLPDILLESHAKPKVTREITQSIKPVKTEKGRGTTNLHSPKVLAGGLPSVNLLEPADEKIEVYSPSALEQLSRLVEAKLADFGVDAHVVGVHPGPVITRFEMQLAPGVKASKITGLARDLARSLAVISVRVVEIIPGRPVIGLELPNQHRQVVRLREIISSVQYDQSSSVLSLALGKDIAGVPVVVDLAKMPHLLVAGTTGAGKSVGLNGMLLSLLFKAQPQDVRLILIDPKMLELSIYEGIPHLLAPVVTDMKEAANALKWCVAEMDRRYKLMAAVGVRNLASYNRKVLDAKETGNPMLDPLWKGIPGPDGGPEELTPLPFIVVVVDEFADMIMVVGKKVEELIARIAQKARAAGIHLILATQRPSVDVITGLIKANVPTRIAFQVASRIDSRTILDQQGAEQLLGRGDMLYLPTGAGIPIRVHGAFVDDHEVHAVVEDWKTRGVPDYCEQILQGTAISGVPGFENEEEDGEQDPLYDEAVQVVIESRKASISLIQRRLKIGYNRAARLVEQMEMSGLVSAVQSNGTREVLVPMERV